MAHQEWAAVQKAEEQAKKILEDMTNKIEEDDEKAIQELRDYTVKLEEKRKQEEQFYIDNQNEALQKTLDALLEEKSSEKKQLNLKRRENEEKVLASILKAVKS